MKLPLPDFGKEIKVGDPSFVYKGIYNAIYWDGDVPYRPRVENLVIRNGKEVFLRLYDDVNDGFTYRYRLPGGSLDNDSTKIKQAENETNEEALLKVKNIVSSGIMYFDQFPEGHLLKKGDICLAYRGNITDVFVSEYAGKMDKSKIDPHDLDDDMANNGKFYYITQIAQLLRQEHVDALLNSSLIDDVTKTLMLRLRRGDIEAKKTYRNLYDEVIPDNKNYESLFENLTNKSVSNIKRISSWLTGNIRYRKDIPNWSLMDYNTFLIQKCGNSHDISMFESILLGKEGYVCGRLALIEYSGDKLTKSDCNIETICWFIDTCDHKYYWFENIGYMRGPYMDIDELKNDISRRWDETKSDYDKLYITTVDNVKSGMNNDDYMDACIDTEYPDDYYVRGKIESVSESAEFTKKIYLVVSHYKSLFGNTVRLITGGYYNHAGLALDKNLDKMYTYSRRTDMNEGRYLGGFAVESFKDFRHGKTDDIDIKVISCDVTKDQYDFVKERIEYLSKNISKTHYNFANLLTTAFNIPVSDNFSSDTVSICSVFVATVMKAIGHPVSNKPVNLVTPDDIAACDSMKGFKSVYTGGVDRFKPVTEQNNVYELESVPKDVEIYHGSPVQGIKEVKAFHNDRIYSELGPVVFASEYPAFSACYGTRWNDKVMKQYTSWENDKLVGVSVKVIDPEILKEWDKPCSLYLLENNGTFKRLPNHPCEVINPNPVKVKKEIKFKSFYDMLKQYRVTIDAPDSGELSNVLKESTLCRTNRAKQLAKVKEMMNPVSEIGAFSTSTTGGGGITLASLRRDKIDQHIINTLSKQFKSLEHVRVDENCNGYIYFDRESSPVAIINVEELLNGRKVIQNLTVVSSYSDSGLEDQLINVAVKELGANFATVSKKNEELIKIYKDNGFREVGNSVISVSLQRGQIVTEGYNDGFLGMYKKTLIGKRVYHGSIERYDMLEPTGLDFGNKLEEPGWSLYTWLDREKAYGWAIYVYMRGVNRSHNYGFNSCADASYIPVVSESGFGTMIEHIRNTDMSERILYVYDIRITEDMGVGLGHSSNTNRCVTIRTPHIKPDNVEAFVLTEDMFRKYTKIATDEEIDRIAMSHANQRVLSFLMDSDLMYNCVVNRKTIKAIRSGISSGKLQPGESIQDFLDGKGLRVEKADFLMRLSVNVLKPKSVRAIKSVRDKFVSESTRSELPDSQFGIPSQRKYELDTKKHVLSAIKLFNWVDEEHEEELARNILKKIDEFHISDDEIHCTEKNRFYKYWKGGK